MLATAGTPPYTVAVTTAAEKVLKDALALTDEEREELVAALTQTLPPIELDSAWKAELARRIAKIESGEAELHDAELYAEQLRAKFE